MGADRKMTIEEAAQKGLLSADVAQEKRDALKRVFPEVFTEGKIDFDQLRRVLGDWVDPGKERYGLSWPGKAACMKMIHAPSIATLKPVREESINFDATKNLFIEGDNLEVLKLLQKAYFEKIKLIYIDPPYNTGKEFIYPDRYQENLDTYLAYTGQVNDKGKKFATNTDTNGRWHSNWLNMMYPRLYLARSLLKDDGVIFISIDDNEVGNLRALCDFVFGEENFVNNIIWQKKYTRSNDAKWFSDNHDHILIYAKSKEFFTIHQLPRSDDQKSTYKNPDNHPKGPWKSTPLHAKSGSNTSPYTFKNGKTWSPPRGTYRRFNDETMRCMDEGNEIYFGENGDQTPRRKSFLSEVKDGVVPVTIWPHTEFGHNHEANNDVKSIGLGGFFDNPKPVRLLENIIRLIFYKEEPGIILDFFAGSSTTGHAVLKKIAEGYKNLNFILVQLPEPCNKGSEAYKANFLNVSDISKERIRRAAKKISDEKDAQLDLRTDAPLDLGFKVFNLDRSNFRIWNGNIDKIEDLIKEIKLHVDHVNPFSKPDDIFYELLLKSGFELTTKIEKLSLAGKDVFSVAEGDFLICLDTEITSELIDALADADPLQVLCLDKGFRGNDQLKANAVHTFKSRTKEGQESIIFRTV